MPIIFVSLESATPTLVDAALRGVPTILPVLDFSTIKNELFPVIATIFSRTNSLAIKVRGLQAFVILCGGSNDGADDDGLSGLSQEKKKSSSSSALDKYTMQEKIIPLVKGIKTKEPAVMMAALNVLKVVGHEADAEFVAMEILPILWNMSLGPLLNLKQFQTFMDLIKTLSGRVEEEQTRKLQELGGSTNGTAALPNDDFMSFGAIAGSSFDANGTTQDDFELLVKGKTGGAMASPMDAGWDSMTPPSVLSPAPKSAKSTTAAAPAFSWSTPSPTASAPPPSQVSKVQQPGFRTVTPDLAQFAALAPSTTQFSQPLQPSSSSAQQPAAAAAPSFGWSAAPAVTANPWATSSTPTPSMSASTSTYGSGLGSSMASMSLDQRPSMSQSRGSSFSLPPPPAGSTANTGSGGSGFRLAPPPGASQAQQTSNLGGSFSRAAGGSMGTGMAMNSMSNNSMGSLMGTGSMNSMGNSSMNGMRNMGAMSGMAQQQQQQQQPQSQPQQPSKSGLDKYESLL